MWVRGAPIGSILVGSKPFIKSARWMRKCIGGGLRQAGVVAAPARVAVEETFLGGKLAQSHKNAQAIAKMWTDLGGRLLLPTDTNMVFLDLEQVGLDRWHKLTSKHGLKVRGVRLVVHYQIGDEAIERLGRVFGEAIGGEVGDASKL